MAALLLVLVLLLLASAVSCHAAPSAGLCRDVEADAQAACRVGAIKSAVAHAWSGYRKYAWGYDDFSPLLNAGVENWHARSTMYDSLDTLWLAGMREEFDEVLEELSWGGPPMPLYAPTKLFEYNIRIIGGLLGAYTLSKVSTRASCAVLMVG